MANKDRIAGMDQKNMAAIYEAHANTMPADQVYRELIKNSLESCARMKKRDPNFKGQILICESPNHPGKISVIDNGEGIPKSTIVPLVSDLAATHEQSKDGNFGHGTKVSAFANNQEGILYHSYYADDDEGSAVKIYKNSSGKYAAKYFEEYGSCRIPLDLESLPDIIRESGHGNCTTLLGNDKNEDTTKPPKNYQNYSLLKVSRVDSIHWLKALLNTKFYEIPDYITLKVQVKREGRVNFETVHGHKALLDKNTKPEHRGTIDGEICKIHWWLREPEDVHPIKSLNDCVMNGQRSILHKGEIFKIEFNYSGCKNPLKEWGLIFSHKRVIVVLEFNNKWHQNPQRTTLHSEKNVDYIDFLSDIRDFFMENLPEPIKEEEARLHRERSKKLRENDELGRKISKYVKELTVSESESGDERMGDIANFFGSSALELRRNKNPIVNPKPNEGPLGGDHFGNDPLMAGIKNPHGRKRAKKVSPNVMPIFKVRDDIENMENYLEYEYDDNVLFLRSDCPLVNEFSELAAKGIKGYEAKDILEDVQYAFRDVLCPIIAITKARDFLSEEDKKEMLQDPNVLLSYVINPYNIISIVQENYKNVVKSDKILNNLTKETKYEVESQIPLPGVN